VSTRLAPPPIAVCLAALAAAGVLAPVVRAAEAPQTITVAEAAEMMISTGRLGVMLDQAEAAMKLRTGTLSEEPVETPMQQQLYVVHELRAAVLRYNVMQFDVCRAHILAGDLCARPYLPDWLKEGADTVPPTPVLAKRVQDAVTNIMPFWQAMCARAVAQTRDETFCAIE
jgi:hypothetical protein